MMNEISYGQVVVAFQVAYALGLLIAGRVVDKIGTRIGYILIMGVWSLSAMGHALASTAFEFGIARFCLGLGESGNFPAAVEDGRRVVPAKGALPGDRYLQLRHERRRNPRAVDRPLDHGALRLARRLPDHRRLQHDLDRVVVAELPQTQPTTPR